jgi:hypothetical protein
MQLHAKERSKSVICRVCKQKFERITAGHLKMHGLTVQAYQEKFGRHPMVCEELRYRTSLKKFKHSPQELILKLQQMAASGMSIYYSEME